MTWTTLSRSNKGQGHQAALLTASGCSSERGNVLGMGNYCYVAVCSG